MPGRRSGPKRRTPLGCTQSIAGGLAQLGARCRIHFQLMWRYPDPLLAAQCGGPTRLGGQHPAGVAHKHRRAQQLAASRRRHSARGYRDPHGCGANRDRHALQNLPNKAADTATCTALQRLRSCPNARDSEPFRAPHRALSASSVTIQPLGGAPQLGRLQRRSRPQFSMPQHFVLAAMWVVAFPTCFLQALRDGIRAAVRHWCKGGFTLR